MRWRIVFVFLLQGLLCCQAYTERAQQKSINDFNLFASAATADGKSRSYRGSSSSRRTKSPHSSGKRSSKSPKSIKSRKSSGKGSTKSPTSLKGEKSGFKSMKKSMGKSGSGNTQPPAASPTLSPISQETALTPFSLLYTLSGQSLALTTEVDEVVALTEKYLNVFFSRSLSNLIALDTRLLGSEFEFGFPFRIDYASTATFSTMNVPSLEELDAVMMDAFAGSNLDQYLAQLQALSNNLFNSTTEVSFNESIPGPSATTRGSKNRGVSMGLSAGAIIIALLGYLVYQKKHENYGKVSGGHVTVTEGTYDETSSFASASVQTMVKFKDTRSEGTSPWALPMHAISECGTATEDGQSICNETANEDDNGSTVGRNEAVPSSGATTVTSTSIELDIDEAIRRRQENIRKVEAPDPGEESEDEDVPMRVVDLIKRFTSKAT